MTVAKYEEMNLNELRQYVLTHREDVEAFHVYVDRSKAEGRMISLDLTDKHWEEKVKEVIMYSSNAIRWYCHETVEDHKEAQTITTWWNQIDKETVTKYHITGIEIDRTSGIWEPRQVNSPVKVLIGEPSLEVGELTVTIKYKDQDGFLNQIEAVAIDLDLQKQNLFVWSSKSDEVFIFSRET